MQEQFRIYFRILQSVMAGSWGLIPYNVTCDHHPCKLQAWHCSTLEQKYTLVVLMSTR